MRTLSRLMIRFALLAAFVAAPALLTGCHTTNDDPERGSTATHTQTLKRDQNSQEANPRNPENKY